MEKRTSKDDTIFNEELVGNLKKVKIFGIPLNRDIDIP